MPRKYKHQKQQGMIIYFNDIDTYKNDAEPADIGQVLIALNELGKALSDGTELPEPQFTSVAAKFMYLAMAQKVERDSEAYSKKCEKAKEARAERTAKEDAYTKYPNEPEAQKAYREITALKRNNAYTVTDEMIGDAIRTLTEQGYKDKNGKQIKNYAGWFLTLIGFKQPEPKKSLYTSYSQRDYSKENDYDEYYRDLFSGKNDL